MSQKVIVRHTHSTDVRPLIELQRRVYPTIPLWREDIMLHQLKVFPQGQIIAEINGELVGAEGLGMHYGQASILTPSDFSFSRDGIAAEGVVNMEQVVIADVDLDALAQNRLNGTTIPLYDKRREVYQLPVEMVSALSGSR